MFNSRLQFHNSLSNESTHDLTVGVSSRSRTSSVVSKPSTLQSGFYRDKKRKRIFKKFNFSKKYFLFFFSIIFLLILLFGRDNLVKFRTVNIETQNLDCLTKIQLEKYYKEKNINLLSNFNQYTTELKRKYICIKDIKYDRQFLNNLNIQLVVRQEVAVVQGFKKETKQELIKEATSSSQEAKFKIQEQITISGNKFLIDEEGFVFANEKEDIKLPFVRVINIEVKIGSQINNSLIKKMMQIIDKLKNLSYVFSQIDLSKEDLEVTTLDLVDPEVKQSIIFALNKDRGRQMASLQLILQKAKIDSKAIEKIDLRFDKPIVVYSLVKKR